MWDDPIIKKIHKFREEHAKKFNFDLRAIFFDLKEQEKRGKRHVVSLPIKRRKGGTPNLRTKETGTSMNA